MKYLLFLLSPIFFFAQKISIEISEDKIIEFYSEKYNQICLNIKNNSDDDYEVIFDKSAFNTAENEAIDDLYIGVPGFRIFDGKSLVKPVPGSYGYQTEILKNDTNEEKKLALFSKKYSSLFENQSDLYHSYKINNRILSLKAREKKSICMNISLPIYRSLADDGSLLYNLETGKKYYLQIFLNVPHKLLKRYIVKSKGKQRIFTGFLISNKIPFIYKE